MHTIFNSRHNQRSLHAMAEDELMDSGRWLSHLEVKLEEPEMDEQQMRQMNGSLWCSLDVGESGPSYVKEEETDNYLNNHQINQHFQQMQFFQLVPETISSRTKNRTESREKGRKSSVLKVKLSRRNKPSNQQFALVSEAEAKAACIYCNKFLKSSLMLYKHVHRQHRDVALKCKQRSCSQYFKSEGEREQHSLLEHALLKIRRPVDCIYCGKNYPDKKSHDHHVKRKHCAEAIKCKYTRCGKLFRTQVELDVHFDMSHADKMKLKSLLCSTCPYRSESKVFLKKHIVQHHFPRLFNCSTCPQKFGSSANLKYHTTSVHMSKKDCPHCGSWLSNTYFNLHSVTAVCRVCTDLFPCVKLLKVHESKCKKFKLLGCVYCRLVCKNKMELREHKIECQLETERLTKINVRPLDDLKDTAS